MQPSDDFTPEVHRRPGASVVAPTGEIVVVGSGDRLPVVDEPADAG